MGPGSCLNVVLMLEVNFQCSDSAKIKMYIFGNLNKFSMKFAGDYLVRILQPSIYGKEFSSTQFKRVELEVVSWPAGLPSKVEL